MAGIYIHVPFCKTKCSYCDFFSKTNTVLKKELVKAITEELRIRTKYLSDKKIETIYFGGGTPSLLLAEDFNKIFETIFQHYCVDENAEITLEANPDDLNDNYIQMLSQQAFNRISIGIQSFQNNELKILNRRHTGEQAITAVKGCQENGFNNISIDLMYGLPFQTMKSWIFNLEKAVSLNVQHISAYNLTIEEGTPIHKQIEKGLVSICDDETSIRMFYKMKETLENAGYEHYEISNFSKPDLISKHNSSYWKGKQYIGIGPSAHSFNGENRCWNISSIPKYLEGIKNNTPVQEIEVLTENMKYNDYILTGLRTKWGINTESLRELFGERRFRYFLSNIKMYLHSGDVIQENDILKITSQGLIISDKIMSDLMYID